MAEGIYKIEIDVNGTFSGSDKLASQTGNLSEGLSNTINKVMALTPNERETILGASTIQRAPTQLGRQIRQGRGIQQLDRAFDTSLTITERFELLKSGAGNTILNVSKKQLSIASGSALAIGAAGLQVYEQNATFNGDSNRVARIGEAKKVVGMLATIGTATAVGGPLGGLAALGYSAFNLALENRKLINTARVDNYQSNYYQDRIIRDTTKRSR